MLEITEREGPDAAPGDAALLVAIMQFEDTFEADRLADRRNVSLVLVPAFGADERAAESIISRISAGSTAAILASASAPAPARRGSAARATQREPSTSASSSSSENIIGGSMKPGFST
ncbi:hypothetical protein GGE16_005452 [Rhizobium leguminosarum]|uniref:Uncharacterized protein n=1 Tax=Rhizobium leguminosarum TaxID=384 RepID=A0AAE2SZG5_RHILE|nr:hypothetical protein [Rhizobium leguminosarum]MBB4435583.1 hypothetical protein [Rhizobium esperanzae]MBB4296024.1 hypothetical protein [Rhizobium leguminosarum]MBB4311373.1 hypothetical protein [Rhizobium leguminosarum]MBB4420249.1 hypothetical protein [Rhizobium leguminosarum]